MGQIKYSFRRDYAGLLLVLASGVKPQGGLGPSLDLASHVTTQPTSLEFILKNKGLYKSFLKVRYITFLFPIGGNAESPSPVRFQAQNQGLLRF